jgi:hypothetical protein
MLDNGERLKRHKRGRPAGTQRIKPGDVWLIAFIQFVCIERLFPHQDPDKVFHLAVRYLESIKLIPFRSRGAHLKRLQAHWRTLQRLKLQRLHRDRLVRALGGRNNSTN